MDYKKSDWFTVCAIPGAAGTNDVPKCWPHR